MQSSYNAINLNQTFVTPVPEPATMLLLGSGLAMLAGFKKIRYYGYYLH